ncbi:MAG: hypothetical protein KME03_06220 [Aphanocapsa lilacina HA4352-LM1]|jgi:hypothetical protein|nr:hypothetical protein [Aphanocapsa lilacina HA4352-LM1]
MSSNWFRDLLMFDGFLAPEGEVQREAPPCATEGGGSGVAGGGTRPGGHSDGSRATRKACPQIGPALVPEEPAASVVPAAVETEPEKPQAEQPLEAQPVADWRCILGWTVRD